MNKFFHLLLLILLFPLTAGATIKLDSLKSDIAKYSNELGFFQIANRDMGDPRFMFRDSRTGLEFGIGGAVRAAAYYSCFGQILIDDFAPSLISIPNDYTPSFGTKISSSEVFFKGRAYMLGKPFIAFLKLNGNADNQIKIDQAYISFAGASIGKIPSFFTDLETGVKTTGIGCSSLISRTHTLFGYEYRFSNGIQLAGAFEAPELKVDHYSDYFRWRAQQTGSGDTFFGKVRNNYQSLPDFGFRAKYRWDGGHVQLSGLLRQLNYWSLLPDDKFESDGATKSAFGCGAMLSGHFELLDKKLYLSYEALCGKGISSYMSDFTKVSVDMGYELSSAVREYASMLPAYVGGVQLAMQYQWIPGLSSSLIYSLRHLFADSRMAIWHDSSSNMLGELSHTDFALVNLVWTPSEFSRICIEAMYADKHLRGYDGTRPHGTALRFALEFAYYF